MNDTSQLVVIVSSMQQQSSSPVSGTAGMVSHSPASEVAGLSAFLCRSKYIVVPDTSVSRLHLNKNIYGKLVGRDILNLHDYLQAFSDILYARSRYSIIEVVHYWKVSYLLLKSSRPGSIHIQKLSPFQWRNC